MIVLRNVFAFLALGLAALPGGCAMNPEMSLIDTFETSAAGSDFEPDSGQVSGQELGSTLNQTANSDAATDLTNDAQSAENARGGPSGLIARDDREATLLYLRSLSQSARGSSARQLSTSAAELKRLKATHSEKALSEIKSGG